MRDTVICAPKRTPVGRFGGAYKDVAVQDLGSTVVRGIMAETGLAPDAVEDVIFANCYPSMDAPAIGRVVALDAGLPIETTGIQIDRRCGSGLQAVIYAVAQVQTGGSDLVIAGGAESMSRAPFYTTGARYGVKGDGLKFDDALARGRVTAGGVNHPVPGGMLETAENLRRDYQIPRDAQDELALRSHQRAAAAQEAGKFDQEVVPVTVKHRRGDTLVEADEHIRPDTTLDSLAALKPIRGKIDDQSTVTAGNASGQNDGAAACIVCTAEVAEQHGLTPMARLKSWSLAGVGPDVMGIGPVASSAKALERAGLGLADMDLIELNEAFAAQVLACTKAMGLGDADWDRINVNGSGVSLGHPVGATGARILATLLHEMDRREARYGLETMCIGGGQGLAAVFERAG